MSDLSEETLFKMDEELAAGFRAEKQMKRRARLERARAVHSQMRVVDLIDIWLRRESKRGDVLLVYRALVDALLNIPPRGETAALHNRLHRVIDARIAAPPGDKYPRDFDKLMAHATLRFFLLNVFARPAATIRILSLIHI